MPLYEYNCSQCQQKRKRMRTTGNRDVDWQCPSCGKPMVRIEFPQDSIKKEGRGRVRDPFQKV